MSGTKNPPDGVTGKVDDTLVAGISTGRLHSVCCDLLQDQAVVADAEQVERLQKMKAVCETIGTQTHQMCENIIAKLQAVGVAVSALNADRRETPAQYQSFQLNIRPQDLPLALDVAASTGFHVDDMARARAGILADARAWIDLMAWDDASFRMRLQWRNVGRLRAKLMPDVADVALIALPRQLRSGYALIRVFRKIYEGATGQKTEDRLGLLGGHLNLGTPQPLVDALLLLGGLKPNETFLDLGCGDGRVVLRAVELFGCRGIGVERNAALVAIARQHSDAMGQTKDVTFTQSDIADAPIEKADVIFLFLPPRLLNAVLNRLRTQARAGTRIIAHEQKGLRTEWPPDETLPVVADNAVTVAHIWVVQVVNPT